MNDQEKSRYDCLRENKPLSNGYLKDFYGITGFVNDFIHDFGTFCGKTKDFDRIEFESFLKQHRLIPKKLLACSMGMTLNSLEIILGMLNKLGLRRNRYEVYRDFLDENLVQDLKNSLEDLKNKPESSDHDLTCRRLHESLSKVGIFVDPYYCETAILLKENPPRLAKYFDCITLKPISPKYSSEMDFKKPLELVPDRCSKLLVKELQNVPDSQ